LSRFSTSLFRLFLALSCSGSNALTWKVSAWQPGHGSMSTSLVTDNTFFDAGGRLIMFWTATRQRLARNDLLLQQATRPIVTHRCRPGTFIGHEQGIFTIPC
jgi:hypothetical protein